MIVRALPREGAAARFTIDGAPAEAWEGESLLVAVLAQRPSLRRLEFGGEPRAGFCLMGACQDCWVWVDGGRARACTTPVRPGMRVSTTGPDWT
jgi:predicted molibdopterin-dependent oxidoreductase YjgC